MKRLVLIGCGPRSIGGVTIKMSKTFGTSTARCLDGSWRWELHVPTGMRQDYMKGFAKTEADADVALKKARAEFERGTSN
jgi:hypothetical protein